MKNLIFSGAATALITPMNEDGSVNYKRLESLVNNQIEAGIDALVICGTTGEKSTLRYDEHLKVIEYAAKAAAKRVPIIAGTGSNDTAHAVEFSQYAESIGADGLLVVTPYYNKTTQHGLYLHTKKIAESVNIPIILYNVPSRTGLGYTIDTLKKLDKIQNINAIKEASGNIDFVAQIAAETDLVIYSGNDDMIVPCMSLGGKGVISVIANILPKETHDICALYEAGKTNESRDLFLKYLELIKVLFIEVNPIPIKTAMN